ncbi:SDR family oxidoreductase, partial [bacterium]|nr:SDR family oxidoreductase [bacterium]
MSHLPNMGLNGKVAVVTGAGSGIGKAVAIAMAEAGADCIPCEHPDRLDTLDSVCEAISQPGQSAFPAPLDLPHLDSIDKMVDHAIESTGRIDILVNNAGINIPSDAF